MKQIVIALAAVVAISSCGTHAADNAAIEKAKKQTIDSMNAINLVKQQVVDSMNAIKNTTHKRSAPAAVSNGNSYESPNTVAADNNVAPAPAPVAPKKKGWSHTAKGAVVGAGAGAITGAIVNKDRLKGAAIGTLIGAGVGAGTGAIVDHTKKKRAAANQ